MTPAGGCTTTGIRMSGPPACTDTCSTSWRKVAARLAIWLASGCPAGTILVMCLLHLLVVAVCIPLGTLACQACCQVLRLLFREGLLLHEGFALCCDLLLVLDESVDLLGDLLELFVGLDHQ